MKIYTATDRAKELGFSTYLEMLEGILKIKISRDICDEHVVAFVDKGRWIAKCDKCPSHGYVCEEEGFFCAGCRNAAHNGKLRPVLFPTNKGEIEEELLKRKVNYPAGMFGTQAALNSDGLPQSWKPGETMEDLEKQRNG